MKVIRKMHINSFLLNIIIIFPIYLSISCQNSDYSNELLSVPIVFNEELEDGHIALDDEQKPYGMIRLKSSFGNYLEKNGLIIPKQDDPAIVGIFSSSDLKLHGIKIPDLDFMVVDYKYPERDGLLGYNFFIKHPMFIDFKNDMLYVKLE